MAPKKRSRRPAVANKVQSKQLLDNELILYCRFVAADVNRCFDNAGKDLSDADDGVEDGKRKRVASAKESQKSTSSEKKASYSHWLMKSEPESRIEKGVDVKVNTKTLLLTGHLHI